MPEIPQQPVDMNLSVFPKQSLRSGYYKGSFEKMGGLCVGESIHPFSMTRHMKAFITDPDMPHSIFEIEGAKKCAIEFRSFSKTAGFTGTRCAFSVIPKELEYDGVSLNKLWDRRQSTKMNGVSYVVQRGAEAVYSEEGKKEVRENIAYYLNNAKIIREGLKKAGFTVYGGEHSPLCVAQDAARGFLLGIL